MDATPELLPHEIDEWVDKLNRGARDWSGRNASDRSAVVEGPGGMLRYRSEHLWEEISYLGYHLHWEFNTLLDLEHRDRRMLVRQVASLNERAWQEVRNQ